MVEKFNDLISDALDEVAPMKSFIVKSHYKFGLSDETKALMRKRDQTRIHIKSANSNEKSVLVKQYKSLRNQVNNKLRKENIAFNKQCLRHF